MPRQLVLIPRFATETRRVNFQSFPSSFPLLRPYVARGRCANPAHVSSPLHPLPPSLPNLEFMRSNRISRGNSNGEDDEPSIFAPFLDPVLDNSSTARSFEIMREIISQSSPRYSIRDSNIFNSNSNANQRGEREKIPPRPVVKNQEAI